MDSIGKIIAIAEVMAKAAVAIAKGLRVASCFDPSVYRFPRLFAKLTPSLTLLSSGSR